MSERSRSCGSNGEHRWRKPVSHSRVISVCCAVKDSILMTVFALQSKNLRFRKGFSIFAAMIGICYTILAYYVNLQVSIIPIVYTNFRAKESGVRAREFKRVRARLDVSHGMTPARYVRELVWRKQERERAADGARPPGTAKRSADGPPARFLSCCVFKPLL